MRHAGCPCVQQNARAHAPKGMAPSVKQQVILSFRLVWSLNGLVTMLYRQASPPQRAFNVVHELLLLPVHGPGDGSRDWQWHGDPAVYPTGAARARV